MTTKTYQNSWDSVREGLRNKFSIEHLYYKRRKIQISKFPPKGIRGKKGQTKPKTNGRKEIKKKKKNKLVRLKTEKYSKSPKPRAVSLK